MIYNIIELIVQTQGKHTHPQVFFVGDVLFASRMLVVGMIEVVRD
jgi:hypothetical protein